MSELPAPSSLMSSRWSRDNLVTSHPARLYDGRIVEPIDQEALELLVQDLPQRLGPVQLGAGRMGVLTWDIACETREGSLVLQVPLALDEPGRRGRAKRDVPRLNVESMRHFIASGLTRFVTTPRDLITLGGHVPAATFEALPNHHPVKFGQGVIALEVSDARQSWLVSLGPGATADVLAEMVAALVYHYEPDTAGGTAVTDVLVNDGDFVARRRGDGSFELRLTAARRREGGIGPSLLLLYLVQMMTFEDWNVDGRLTGLPVLISNPSVTFAGVVRGLRYRCRDLGRPEQEGVELARRWIQDYSRSRAGRGYRPWAERFLAGELPLSFGSDLRERWWRLIPVQKKQSFLELVGRREATSPEALSARSIKTFLERLSREIGRPPVDEPGTVRVNDLDREGLMSLLAEAGVEPEARPGVTAEIFAGWPYRNLDQLLAKAPGARGLRRLKSRLTFGRIVSDADQGTLRSLGPAPKAVGSPRLIANPEVLCPIDLPTSLGAAAVQAFPTFEAYMDAALHDPKWGYYGHQVVIGQSGAHFSTNPENVSPHYGRWVAGMALKAWRDMIAHGELDEAEPFPVIEFGAGNGRLARDFIDGVAQNAGDAQRVERDAWRAFGSRMQYRIYETSALLRDKQRALLGDAAEVTEGDARRPAETLRRDFPNGVKGFVVSNEVPDAFGVHKVRFASTGEAHAALVVPRAEPSLLGALADTLAQRVADADASLRRTFHLTENPGDLYLDRATFGAVMAALADFPSERRGALLDALWFEEAYIPTAEVPDLAAHLCANAQEYAAALAAEPSGVILYVNVHAGRFMRELGSALRAGFIVTIDYGDTTSRLVHGARRGDFPFRVYGDWQDYVPRPNDPYTAPGTQDLTADVNFTELAQAGAEAGLCVVHFGPERDVIGDELPDMLQAAASEESIAKFLGDPVFKLLVLGKRESALFSGGMTTSLPLTARTAPLRHSR